VLKSTVADPFILQPMLYTVTNIGFCFHRDPKMESDQNLSQLLKRSRSSPGPSRTTAAIHRRGAQWRREGGYAPGCPRRRWRGGCGVLCTVQLEEAATELNSKGAHPRRLALRRVAAQTSDCVPCGVAARGGGNMSKAEGNKSLVGTQCHPFYCT
jgi:hypothetical protein